MIDLRPTVPSAALCRPASLVAAGLLVAAALVATGCAGDDAADAGAVPFSTKRSWAKSCSGRMVLMRSSGSSGSRLMIGLPRAPRLARGTW